MRSACINMFRSLCTNIDRSVIKSVCIIIIIRIVSLTWRGVIRSVFMHKIKSLSACIHWIRSVCVNINSSVIRSVCIKKDRSAIRSVCINIIKTLIRIVLIFWIQTEIFMFHFSFFLHLPLKPWYIIIDQVQLNSQPI